MNAQQLHTDTVAKAQADHKDTVEDLDQLGKPAEGQSEAQLGNDEKSLAAGQEIKMVPFANIFRRDNVRDPEDLHLEKMIDEFKTVRYFKHQYPLVLSLQTHEDDFGPNGEEMLVLCGNRRTEALEVIEREDPRLFEELCPGGLIPAVVHVKLNKAQEALIRNDHSSREDRVGLGDASLFRAIRQLITAGYTEQTAIARKLGLFTKKDGEEKPNRSFVQKRVELAQMPKYIQEEFIQMWRDKDSTPVRMSDISKLRKAQNLDFNNGKNPSDGGPELKKVWNAIMDKNTSDDDKESAARAIPKSELEMLSKTRNSEVLREVLMRCAGNTKVHTLDQLDETVIRLEESHKLVKKIGEFLPKSSLGITFKQLVDIIQEAENAEKEAAKAAAEAAQDDSENQTDVTDETEQDEQAEAEEAKEETAPAPKKRRTRKKATTAK